MCYTELNPEKLKGVLRNEDLYDDCFEIPIQFRLEDFIENVYVRENSGCKWIEVNWKAGAEILLIENNSKVKTGYEYLIKLFFDLK